MYDDPAELIRSLNRKMPDILPFESTFSGGANFNVAVPVNEKAVQFKLQSKSNPIINMEWHGPRVRLEFSKEGEVLRRMLGCEFRIQSPWIFFAGNTFRDKAKWSIMTGAEKAANLKKGLGDADINTVWESVSTKTFDPTTGNQTLYVYCSVADFSFVGDEKAQILRTLAVSGNNGDIKTERFDMGHYVPVLPSLFETIHINIANDHGETARFHSGKSLVKLHFRPYRSF